MLQKFGLGIDIVKVERFKNNPYSKMLFFGLSIKNIKRKSSNAIDGILSKVKNIVNNMPTS